MLARPPDCTHRRYAHHSLFAPTVSEGLPTEGLELHHDEPLAPHSARPGQPGRLHHAMPTGLPTVDCGIATCPSRATDTVGLSPTGLQPCRPLPKGLVLATKSPVGTFTAANQPMSPRSHTISTGLTFRPPGGRSVEDAFMTAGADKNSLRERASPEKTKPLRGSMPRPRRRGLRHRLVNLKSLRELLFLWFTA